MSDAPETRRGGTAPLPITAQPGGSAAAAPAAVPAPAARPVTQLSPSAVPSTLDSPQEPPRTDASLRHEITAQDDGARIAAERDAAFAAAGIAAAGPAGPAGPAPLAPQDPSPAAGRRGLPPTTLMSPAVPAPGDQPPSPSLAPEDAVIDVGAPAHAFLPPGRSPGYGGGVAPGGVMPGGAHAGAGHGPRARRPTSTTFLVVVVVVGFAGLVVLAGAVIGVFYFAERRKAETAAEGRALHGPVATTTPTIQEPARTPPRFGGAKARLAVTSGGAMDPEAVRASLAGVLPRIDACFAAAELEPPNHESVAYDLDVQPNGEVKRVEPVSSVSRAPKLDACVESSLRAVRLPKSARASVVKLTFSAPVDLR